VAAAEQAAALVDFVSSVNESATAIASDFAAGQDFDVDITETATVSDQMAGSYLWNPVDDNQTANWQNVDDSQSGPWTPVNDNQSTTWTDIPTVF